MSIRRQRSLQNGNQVVPYTTGFLQVGQGTVRGIPNHCTNRGRKVTLGRIAVGRSSRTARALQRPLRTNLWGLEAPRGSGEPPYTA
jgi:hypothetical protein